MPAEHRPIAASHGFSAGTAGMLLAIFSLSHVTSTLALGVVSSRFGNRLPLAGLALTVAAGTALVGLATSLPVMIAGVVLVGFGGGLFTLLPAAAAVEFGANGVGRAFGMLMLFIPINAAVPSAIAKVRESTGSYAPALLALAAFCLVGGGAILLMRERSGGRPAGLGQVEPQPHQDPAACTTSDGI